MTTKKAASSGVPGSTAANPRYFATPARLRAWFERHHLSATELWVGMYKKASGRPSVAWPDLVDACLCFGWIDGVRKRLDDEAFVQRVTPRSARSVWSAVNIRRIEQLMADGLVQPAGEAAFERRTEDRSQIYSYEQRDQAAFDDERLQRLRSDTAAWRFFTAQPAGYRQLVTYWVMTAKKPETRDRRLAELIARSADGRRVGLFDRTVPSSKSAGA